jgi:hypothetical protein
VKNVRINHISDINIGEIGIQISINIEKIINTAETF